MKNPWSPLLEEIGHANEGTYYLDQKVWAKLQKCEYPLAHYKLKTGKPRTSVRG